LSWALIASVLTAQAGPLTVGLPALLAGSAPTLTGGGALLACQSEARPLADLEELLAQVEGHLNYAELEAAQDALAEARVVARCLGEPLPGNLVARISFLAGVRAWLAQDREGSEGYFLEALRLRESLVWDPSFAPELRQPFEAARARLADDPSSWLRVVPVPAEGRLWVDGVPVDDPLGQVSLGPGLHFVQLSGPTWTTLVLDLPPAGASVLWLPQEVDEGAVAWVEDPDRRADLDGLLSLALPQGSTITLTTETTVWAGQVGTQDWAPVEAVRHRWRWVGLGGLAVAGGSLAIAGTGYAGALQARSASLDATDRDAWTDYQLAVQRHELSSQLYRVGLVGLAGGVALAGVGFALDRWAVGVGTAQGAPLLTLGRGW